MILPQFHFCTNRVIGYELIDNVVIKSVSSADRNIHMCTFELGRVFICYTMFVNGVDLIVKNKLYTMWMWWGCVDDADGGDLLQLWANRFRPHLTYCRLKLIDHKVNYICGRFVKVITTFQGHSLYSPYYYSFFTMVVRTAEFYYNIVYVHSSHFIF